MTLFTIKIGIDKKNQRNYILLFLNSIYIYINSLYIYSILIKGLNLVILCILSRMLLGMWNQSWHRTDSLYNQWRPCRNVSCHEYVMSWVCQSSCPLCSWPTPSFWHHADHAKDRVLHIHKAPITSTGNYPLPQYISKFTCPV